MAYILDTVQFHLTVLMTLGVVLLTCEVHSNCTLKNFFNEPVVPPYCQPRCVWIGSLASVTVKRRPKVSVIGFLF